MAFYGGAERVLLHGAVLGFHRLAIRAGALADSSLLARKLGAGDLGLFASPDYLERRGRPRRIGDLPKHECILYRAGGPTATWRLSEHGHTAQVTVQGRVDADEFTFVRRMALAGAGIALAPIHYFAPLVSSGQLERVLSRLAHRGNAVQVVWPSRRFEPAAVALFREAITDRLPELIAGRAPPQPAERSPGA